MPEDQAEGHSRLKRIKRAQADHANSQNKHLQGLRSITGSTTAVSLLEHREGQCRAIISYQNDLVERAVVCGEPVVDKLDGGKSSWCDFHHARYMVAPEDARPRRAPIIFKPSPKMFRKTVIFSSSAAA